MDPVKGPIESPKGLCLTTRMDLYEAVWAGPMVHVAAKIGLSDVGLAKLCKRLQVPVPGRGYWAQVKAGVKVRKRALPNPEKDMEIPHEIQRLERSLAATAELVLAKERVKGKFGPELGSKRLSESLQIHALVQDSMSWLMRSGAGTDQIRKKHRCVAIAVSESALDRAAKVMTLALTALEERGLKVEVTMPVKADPDRGVRVAKESCTVAWVHNFQIPFEVCELVQESEIPSEVPTKPPRPGAPPPQQKPPKIQVLPTGKLMIRITEDHPYGIRRRWSDRKAIPVEEQIPAFVESVLILGERRQKEEEEWARRKAQWDEEARIRRAEAERNATEAILVHDLHSRAEDWRKGQEIKAFLEAFEARRSGERGELQPGTELAGWVAWAYQHAASLQDGALEESQMREPPKERKIPFWG